MNRVLVALFSALLLLQPASGHAKDIHAMKEKTKKLRASSAEKGKRQASLAEQFSVAAEAIDGCCGCYAITPECFGEESDTTFIIKEPGKYTLQQDVVFFPADEFTPAINILSDNVTLDLCSHTLSQGNQTPNCYGIQIGAGYFYADPDNVYKNIEVANGSVVDFSGIGVFCYNASFDGPTAQLPFEDLRLLGLNILNCGSSPSDDYASGINFDSFADLFLYDPTVQVAYKNVTIDNCKVNRCLGNGAINLYTGENVVLSNTQANDFFSSTSTFFGGDWGPSGYQLFCRNLQMYNCQGNGTKNIDSESFVLSQLASGPDFAAMSI